MKVASKGEKVNRDDVIAIYLVYNNASKTTVKALRAVLNLHGVPEDKQVLQINSEGAGK